MAIQRGRHLANEYFTSRAKLIRFFRGEAGFARIHHGEIASRTFLPGEEYPNATLLFYDTTYPDYGHVWKLPCPTRAEKNIEMKATRRVVTGANVYTTIPRAPNSGMTLQQVVHKLGPGVYIINACLVARNQGNLPVGKIPFNLPVSNMDRRAPRRSRDSLAYAKSIYGRKTLRRPGTPFYTHGTLRSRRAARAKVPHVTVREILMRLGRPGANINLNNWFPRMSANVNRPRLQAVQNIIKDPKIMTNKLGQTAVSKWNSLPWNQRGPFVANWLNKSGYIFKAQYNNKTFWINGNTGKQIAPPDPNKIKTVIWSNKVNNAFENASVFAAINAGLSNNINWNWTVWRLK